jgi:uracil-DNA glycosylase
MSSDARAELGEIAAMAAELLEWERVVGSDGIALAPRPAEAGISAQPAPAGAEAPSREPAAPAPLPPQGAPPAEAPTPASAPAAGSRPDPRAQLEVLAAEAAACTGCGLHRGRTRSVFARGNPASELVFVGEGPGYHEDQQGQPFVGKAGELLDRMIAAMGYGRDEVYICNVVKCRPPDNRTPLPDEAAACEPFLRGQLAAIAPKVIVALGKCAAQNLGAPASGRWRGVWGAYQGIPLMPTYHPAFLLRSPEYKRPVWEDLQAVMARLGRTGPGR